MNPVNNFHHIITSSRMPKIDPANGGGTFRRLRIPMQFNQVIKQQMAAYKSSS
jgi:hypothetical protein